MTFAEMCKSQNIDVSSICELLELVNKNGWLLGRGLINLGLKTHSSWVSHWLRVNYLYFCLERNKD
jgi:hypothetical protein